jgi:photosystem II stability/assembly factor-like uncharacterized protein
MMRMTAIVAALASAVAQKWSVISGQVGQGATGLGMFDGNNGIIAASDGLGYVVYKTTDGGKTWPTEVPNTNFYIFPLFDSSAFGTVGVAVGQYDAQYTVNTAGNFNTSLGGAGAVASRVIAGNAGFGIVGQFGNTNGVAISTDFGLTFTTSADCNLTTPTGFGAFPSANAIYVTGATVPSSGDDNTGSSTSSGTSTGGSSTSGAEAQYATKRVSSRISIVAERNGPARHEIDYGKSTSLRGRSLQTNGSYAGQVAQSTDGGKTWATTLDTQGQFALNGIDCADTTHCCTVGEAADGAAAGAYIYCTSNGGSSWTQTYNTTVIGASLVDIRAVSSTEYWAVGGTITTTAISAEFLHSTDGGNTWTIDTTIPDYFGTGIECVASANQCWSTIIDNNENSFVASNA